MKINPNQITDYLAKIKFKSFFLIFGSNFGLINQSFEKILNALEVDKENPFSTVYINHDQLLDDQTILLNEIDTYPVFENFKNILIDIRNTSNLKKLYNIFLKISDLNVTKHRIIIKANHLKSNDQIVKLFNNLENGVSVACYEEQKNMINSKLNSYLKEKNIKLNTNEYEKLLTKFSKNSEINENIYEKLNLIGLSKNINITKINDSVNESFEIEINELINLSLCGQYKESLHILNKFKLSKVSSILICRQYIYKFKLLEKIFLLIEQGISIDKILQKSELKIFFQERNFILSQIKLWNLKKIYTSINKLLDTEIKCKRLHEMDYSFIENVVLFIKIQSQKT